MPVAGKRKLRRPHYKTRAGCVQCKQQRLKCDEQKPVCNRCHGSGRICSFLSIHPHLHLRSLIPPLLSQDQQSTGSPSHTPPVQSLPDTAAPQPFPQPILNFTALDLEILHFFITTGVFTFIDFPAGVKLFQTDVIKLAFEHHFLLHTILSFSSLQLSATDQGSLLKSKLYTDASDSHLATALSLFQPEISNLGKHNCDACYVFSTIMFRRAWVAQDLSRPSTLFFASDEPPGNEQPAVYTTQWIKLHFGASTILNSIWPLLQTGCLKPLFKPWDGLDENREDPLEPIEREVLDDVANSWHNPASTLLPKQKETLDYILSKVRRVYSMINPKFNVTVSEIPVVMAWFTWLSEDFLIMVEAKQPEALLLVVYYCVCLKKIDHLWWMRGKAENLLETVMDVLDKVEKRKWERWTRWPIQKILE